MLPDNNKSKVVRGSEGQAEKIFKTTLDHNHQVLTDINNPHHFNTLPAIQVNQIKFSSKFELKITRKSSLQLRVPFRGN